MNNKESDTNIDKILSKNRTKLDCIEKREKELNDLTNTTNNIKKNSIKEFLYSNKNVPKIWKTKKNYNNLVLELIDDDSNFLKYLGNNFNNVKNVNFDNNIRRSKTAVTENKEFCSETNKNETFSFKRFEKPENKINIIINPQIEMENIFEYLNEKYPIKKKLIQLFPNYKFNKTKFNKKSNYSFDSKNGIENSIFIRNSVVKNKLKYIGKMEKNIYNNLFTKNNNINSANKRIFKNINNDFDYKRKNRMKIIQKELNDSKIFSLLQNVNLYGPYFSYCPYCYDNNINFYKNIGKKQCISILNYIKNDKYKERKINPTKLKKNLKLSTNFF